MATGKQTRGERPTLGALGNKGKDKELTEVKKEAKEKVEKMFRGETGAATRTTEATNDRLGLLDKQPSMKVDTEIPLPEHAEENPEVLSVRDVKDRIDAVFDTIGTEYLPDTKYPEGRDNKAAQASEYVVAEQLKKRAEKRFNKAKQEAEAVGCFGLPESHVAGETVETYRSPHFTFAVKKGEPTQMVDRELVINVLKEIAPTKWQQLLSRCLKERAGPTQVITAMK